MARSMIRVGPYGARKGAHGRMGKRSSCSTDFIQAPTSGQEVDAADTVSFVWDSSCLNITAADIYLYAPYQATPLIQMFQNVDFAKGSYNTTLKPKWWNSTSTVDLQLKMVETGQQIFQATLPPGPIWTANYNASEATAQSSDIGATSSTDSNVTEVNNLQTKGGGISKGGLAAAVLVPLIVIGLALGIYIKHQRTREKKIRKRWSEKIDQRMSVLSLDWRAMSAKGAEAAIRTSMADPNRSSVWSRAASGPSSTFAMEGPPSDNETPMVQIRRPGVGLRGPMDSAGGGAPRVSRISFAADTRFSRASSGDAASKSRPSTDSRRAGTSSRAFHSAYIPPVPSRLSEFVHEEAPHGSDSDESTPGFMSPTQRDGPEDLSATEIQARLNAAHDDAPSQPSIDEMMPALNMMRAMDASDSGTSFSLPLEREREFQPQPAIATVDYAQAPPSAALKSPGMGASPMPMSPMGQDSMLSPDAMLRAYAERRQAGGAGAGGFVSPPGTPVISYPMPIAVPGATALPNPGIGAGGMRTLYSPPTTSASFAGMSAGSSAGSVRSSDSNNPFRKSMAMARQDTGKHFDDIDAYFGTAE